MPVKYQMSEYGEVKTLSRSLFTILKVEDLFRKTEFYERHLKQLDRLRQQFNVLQRKVDMTDNHLDEYRKWHNEKKPQFPMSRGEVFVEVTTLLCYLGLAHYEILKRFFIETLILEKLQSKTGVTTSFRSTYGTFVTAFQKLSNFDPKMNEMLNQDLRNALAHDTWYFEEGQLRYVAKNNTVKIPFAQIPHKINTIGAVYTSMFDEYTKQFFPDEIRKYEKLGSKKYNEFFPLYNMGDD